MLERLGLSGRAKAPVLSLQVEVESATVRRSQGQFEVLVRHLIYRFFHNELLASDDETKRVLQLSYAVALPGLLVALFLFPAYHAFPPDPFPRPYWPQVGDHYFYVMYSFVLMGAATVYEWDLLFPDLLDVFVLSVQPTTNRRLFLGRVVALGVFLGLVLLGTSLLGIFVFPLVAELPHPLRQVLAHAAAVLMSGAFAAASFLALQGVLLNFAGERFFRRMAPLIQGLSLMFLLAVLLLYPTLSHDIRPLLSAGGPAVLDFPPFWFLGVYERLLVGPSALPVFHQLAATGCWAIAAMLGCVVATYPLAYRRRVRQLIEGGTATAAPNRPARSFSHALHATLLRHPAQRAIFHFISQTVLRSQRQRVLLAMYGGLSLALVLAGMLVLRFAGGHVYPALLPYGIRAAVPVVAFWAVAGLRAAFAAPVDRRGAWVFRLILGNPKAAHLAGTRIWITGWTACISVATALVLHVLSPASMQTMRILAGQLVVAVGLSFLLTDLFLFSTNTLPFTHVRKSSITDFPLIIMRYFILFPLFVAVAVRFENRIEASTLHMLETGLVFATAHLLLQHFRTRSLLAITVETPADELDEFPQRLGLRNR